MAKNQTNLYGGYPQQQQAYNPYGQTGQYGYDGYGVGQNPLYTAQVGGPVPGYGFPQQPVATPGVPGMLPIEESYIENILRLNKGKVATVYTTFENNREWNAKVFKGVIEAAGRDHLILSDPQTGMRYLILMIYVDYVTFDEEIEYEYPFAAGAPGLAAYPPR